MDFAEFEQLVLRILFESDVPLTAAHCAYLGRIPVRTAEKHLARLVQRGTLHLRVGSSGVAEYVYPGRRAAARHAHAAAGGPPPVSAGALMLVPPPASSSPVTSVLLSMLIPGAGHIYAGRPGAGVAWMCTTLLGYACCFLPGLFLHGLCLVSAANTPPPGGAKTRAPSSPAAAPK